MPYNPSYLRRITNHLALATNISFQEASNKVARIKEAFTGKVSTLFEGKTHQQKVGLINYLFSDNAAVFEDDSLNRPDFEEMYNVLKQGNFSDLLHDINRQDCDDFNRLGIYDRFALFTIACQEHLLNEEDLEMNLINPNPHTLISEALDRGIRDMSFSYIYNYMASRIGEAGNYIKNMAGRQVNYLDNIRRQFADDPLSFLIPAMVGSRLGGLVY